MKDCNSDNERLLLAGLAAGDERALCTIHKLYWSSLFVSSFNIIKDAEVCKDILQEIFIDVWVRRERLIITTSLSGYLHTATKYKVFKYIRKQSTSRHFFENLNQRLYFASADSDLLLKETGQQINKIIEALPERCKIIYILSREQSLSHREISALLKISVKTVENQITIALRRLSASLQDSSLISLILAIGVPVSLY